MSSNCSSANNLTPQAQSLELSRNSSQASIEVLEAKPSKIEKKDKLVTKQNLTEKQKQDAQAIFSAIIYSPLMQIQQVFESLDKTSKTAFSKLKDFSKELKSDKALDKGYEDGILAIRRMSKSKRSKLPQDLQDAYKANDKEAFKTSIRSSLDETLDKMRADDSFDHKDAIAAYENTFDERKSPLARVLNSIVRSNLELQRSNKAQTKAFAKYARQMTLANSTKNEAFKKLRNLEGAKLVHLDRLILKAREGELKNMTAEELAKDKDLQDATVHSAVAQAEDLEDMPFAGESLEDSKNKICVMVKDHTGQMIKKCGSPEVIETFLKEVRENFEKSAFDDVAEKIDENTEKAISPKSKAGTVLGILSDKVKNSNLLRVSTGDELAVKVAKGEAKKFTLSDKFKYLYETLKSTRLISHDQLSSGLTNADGSPTELAALIFSKDFIKTNGMQSYAIEASESGTPNLLSLPAASFFERSYSFNSESYEDPFNQVSYTQESVETSKLEEEPEHAREVIADKYGIPDEVDVISPGALEKALKQMGYSFKEIAHIVGDSTWVISEIRRQYNFPSFLSASAIQDIIKRILAGDDPNAAIREISNNFLSKENAQKIDDVFKSGLNAKQAVQEIQSLQSFNITIL